MELNENGMEWNGMNAPSQVRFSSYGPVLVLFRTNPTDRLSVKQENKTEHFFNTYRAKK